MFEVIFSFAFGAVFYILIVLISYLDSVNFLLKIMKLFSNKKPRGYGDYQKVRQSAQYKNHKNKWMMYIPAKQDIRPGGTGCCSASNCTLTVMFEFLRFTHIPAVTFKAVCLGSHST